MNPKITIQILLGSFRPELQPEVASIVSVLTPRLYFRNAHEKYRKTITRDFNSLAPFLLRVMSTHPKRSTDHGGGRRGCGCRRGGSPRPPEKQQEAVGSKLERDPWPPRRVHWRRWCGALGVGAWCHSFFCVRRLPVLVVTCVGRVRSHR